VTKLEAYFMSKAILELARGLVRPIGLLIVIGGVAGLAVYHGVTKDALEGAAVLAAFGGPIVGWWFKERADRHDKGDGV
jgi:hypothetical protein